MKTKVSLRLFISVSILLHLLGGVYYYYYKQGRLPSFSQAGEGEAEDAAQGLSLQEEGADLSSPPSNINPPARKAPDPSPGNLWDSALKDQPLEQEPLKPVLKDSARPLSDNQTENIPRAGRALSPQDSTGPSEISPAAEDAPEEDLLLGEIALPEAVEDAAFAASEEKGAAARPPAEALREDLSGLQESAALEKAGEEALSEENTAFLDTGEEEALDQKTDDAPLSEENLATGGEELPAEENTALSGAGAGEALDQKTDGAPLSEENLATGVDGGKPLAGEPGKKPVEALASGAEEMALEGLPKRGAQEKPQAEALKAAQFKEEPESGGPPSAQQDSLTESAPSQENAVAENSEIPSKQEGPELSGSQEESKAPPPSATTSPEEEREAPPASDREEDESKSSRFRSFLDLKQRKGNPALSYPRKARLKKAQGTLSLIFYVTAEGLVEKIQVETSSGHRDLDNSVVQAVSRYQFLPQQEGWVRHKVDFRLQGERVEFLRLREK